MKSDNAVFAKNVFIVSMGPVVSAMVSFLAEPWIARFWEPYKFGMASYFNALLLMISPLIFLRYNFALVQADSEEEKHSLLVLSLMLMVLILGALYLASPWLESFATGNFPVAENRLLILFTVMFASAYVLFRFWASSNRRFIEIAVSTIILQTANTILLIILGAVGRTSAQTAIYIRAVSYWICPLVMIASYLKNGLAKTIEMVRWQSIVRVLKKYKRFPMFEFWGVWASTIATNIPAILIAKYWGQATNGHFTKAFGIVYLLVLFIGDSVNRVFHKEVADLATQGKNISVFVSNVISSLSQLSVLPFTLLILVGPELFKVVLGPQWLESGYYARVISIWMYTVLISISVMPLYGVLNKQLQHTFFSVSILIIRVATLIYLGSVNANPLFTVGVFSAMSVLLIGFQFSFIVKVAGVRLRLLGRLLVKPILHILPLVFSVIVIRMLFTPSDILILVVTGVLSMPYLYFFYYKQESVKSLILSANSIMMTKYIIPLRDRWL